jgi:hypothetical protein
VDNNYLDLGTNKSGFVHTLPSGRLRRDPSRPRSFDASGRVAGSQGLRREDAVCGDGVAVR